MDLLRSLQLHPVECTDGQGTDVPVGHGRGIAMIVVIVCFLQEAVFNRDSRVQGLQRFHAVHMSFCLKLNKHFHWEG